jgi:cellulose synthase/poly-beta-1,6-N-acetylglucosamine synthase-like glycosyltransferase
LLVHSLICPDPFKQNNMSEAVIQMSDPLVSIVVPVYKVELYLERCLDSIVAQVYSTLK